MSAVLWSLVFKKWKEHLYPLKVRRWKIFLGLWCSLIIFLIQTCHLPGPSNASANSNSLSKWNSPKNVEKCVCSSNVGIQETSQEKQRLKMFSTSELLTFRVLFLQFKNTFRYFYLLFFPLTEAALISHQQIIIKLYFFLKKQVSGMQVCNV